MKTHTIRELKEFINSLPEEVLESPIVVEDEDCERYEINNIGTVHNPSQSYYKLLIEFSHEDKE